MSETKVHFKLYKSGKKWLVAAIGVTTLGIGLSQAPNVHADTDQADQAAGDTDQATTTDTTNTGNSMTLKSSSTTQNSTSTDTKTNQTSSPVKAATNTTPASNNDSASDNADKATSTTSSSNVETNQNQQTNSDAATNQLSETTSTATKSATSRMAVTESADVSAEDTSTNTATMPAIVNDPSATISNVDNTKTISTQVTLTAKNNQGTVTSMSSDKKEQWTAASVLVDADATDLTVNYTITNNTDTTQNQIKTAFALPKFTDRNHENTQTTETVLPDSVTEATFTQGMPSTLKLKYTVDGGNWLDYSELSNVKMSDIIEFEVVGSLAANESYTWSIPLETIKQDVYTNKGIESVGASGLDNNINGAWLQFRFVHPISTQGQFRLVTLVKAGTSTTAAEYKQVPASVQALMPDIPADAVTLTNLFSGTGKITSDALYTGGTVKLDLTKTNVDELINQNGYFLSNVLYDKLSFDNTALTPIVDDTDGMDVSKFAPVVYLVVQKEFETKDSNLLAGTAWTDTDNLISASDEKGQALPTSKVNITVNDPTGIVQKGKVTKNGTFTVTYSYSGGFETVTATATINVTGAQLVNFIDPDGTSVGTAGVTMLDGATQDITPLLPANYKLAPNQSSTISLNGDENTPISVNVVLDEQTYTINFVDQFGKIVGTTTATGINGGQADISKTLPSGYRLDDGVDGNLTFINDSTDPLEVQVVNSDALSNADSPVPAITNDTDGQDTVLSDDIIATAQLAATNDQGTSLSQTSNYQNNGAIVNANSTSISAIYRISNTTNTTKTSSDLARFYLPENYNSFTTTRMTLADGTDENTFEKSLPAGLTVTYSTDGWNFYSWADLQQRNAQVTFQDIKAFQVSGTMAANASHTFTLPLKVLTADYYEENSVDWLGATSEPGSTNLYKRLAFRFAKSLNVNEQGQYEAVIARKINVLNDAYSQVDENIQQLLPNYASGDISYNNFYNDNSTKSSRYTYTGGLIKVDLNKTGIADLVKDKGYSLLLKDDGSGMPQEYYIYQSVADPTVSISGNGSGTSSDSYVPNVYITLRPVVSTADSSLKIGDNWSRLNNLVSVIDNTNETLSADDLSKDVTVTINDPDGIIKDGKAVKTGKFTVTYAYQLASDYYDKNQPYVVSNTATVTVDGDYTINFVDPNDPSKVLKSITVDGAKDGDTHTLTASEIPDDYQLAENQAATVTFGDDPTVASVVNVVPIQHEYTVEFVTDWTTVLKTIQYSGINGETHDFTADVPADYQLADGQSGTLTLSDPSVTKVIKVNQMQHGYTVNFVDVQGHTLGTNTYHGVAGKTQDITANVPADYQLVHATDAEVTFSTTDQTKNVEVAKQQHTYTVEFQDEAGVVRNRVTIQGTNGATHDFSEAIPADYQLATGASASLTLSDPSVTKVIKATQQSHDYTVDFETPAGKQIKEVVVSGHNGDTHDFTADIPADYQLVAGQSASLKLTDPTTPKVIQVEQQSHDYTVDFATTAGKVLKTVTVSGHNGDTHDFTDQIPADYQLAKGASASLVLSDPAKVQTIQVEQQQHRYTVNFMDEQGQLVKTTQIDGHNGQTTDVTDVLPADYQLIQGESAQVTLNDPSQPLDVKVTKQQHTYTLNFVDGSGTTLKTIKLTGNNGGQTDVTADIPSDYQLATGQSAQVTLKDPTQPINLQVVRQQKTYTVEFVDDQQHVVKTESIQGTTDQQVDLTGDVPVGYHLLPGVSAVATLAENNQLAVTVNVLKDAVTSSGSQSGSQASQATSQGSTAASQVTSQGSTVASQATSQGSTTTSQASQAAALKPASNVQSAATKATQSATKAAVAPASAASAAAPSSTGTVKAAGAAATVQPTQPDGTTPKANAAALPQTDEQTEAGAIALGFSALTGLLGLAGVKRNKRRHQD